MVNLASTPGAANAAGNGTTTANATLNQDAGTITTEPLQTAAGATCLLTVFCNQVTPNSIVSVELYNGTNVGGDPSVGLVTPGNGVVTIAIVNRGVAAFTNGAAAGGTIKVSLIVFN